MLLQLGPIGLYARQPEAAGVLGLVSFLMAFIGTGSTLGVNFVDTFVMPTLAVEAPGLLEAGPTEVYGFGFIPAALLLVVGWLLFGLATLRARVYPREAAILLIVGPVLLPLPLPVVGIVFGVAVAWSQASSCSQEWALQ